jgi:hypothetical protein
MAEHALTGHKVAIKILNRKKIKAMDMDEKGAGHGGGAAARSGSLVSAVLCQRRPPQLGFSDADVLPHSAPRNQDPAPLHAPAHHPLVRGGRDAY